MNHSKSRAIAMSLAVLLSTASVSVITQTAIAAEKKQEISRSIAKEMAEAQKDIQKSSWADALKNLDAAEAKGAGALTPFDKKTIAEFRAFAYVKTQNYKGAQQAYEAQIASGALTAEESAKVTKVLFQLAAQNQNYPKAIEYGKQMADNGSANVSDLTIMAQLYYQQKDCKNSAVWSDKAAAAAKKAGETPKENVYLFKLQCASDSQDNPGMAAALVDLIKITNKTSYWNNLIRIERQDERDDHNLLMIYRVMYDTNSMNAGSDYVEMAQLLGDNALPGEAQAVLEKGLSSGAIKEESKERTNRLLNSMKTRADTDKKGLPQFDAEATKAAAGELDVKLGEVYFGTGDYQNAVTAINRGIGKGQIKHLDEAYVYLGRAQVALKNNADAKKALSGLKNAPNISPRVLKLWDLYADKLGTPYVATAPAG